MGEPFKIGESWPYLSTPVCDLYVYPQTSTRELRRVLESLPEMVKEIEEAQRKNPVLYVYRERRKTREIASTLTNLEPTAIDYDAE